MRATPRTRPVSNEPTATDLAEIEAEWPLIAAELAVVEAECRMATAPHDVLARRAYRRAVRSVLSASLRGPSVVASFGTGPDAA